MTTTGPRGRPTVRSSRVPPRSAPAAGDAATRWINNEGMDETTAQGEKTDRRDVPRWIRCRSSALRNIPPSQRSIVIPRSWRITAPASHAEGRRQTIPRASEGQSPNHVNASHAGWCPCTIRVRSRGLRTQSATPGPAKPCWLASQLDWSVPSPTGPGAAKAILTEASSARPANAANLEGTTRESPRQGRVIREPPGRAAWHETWQVPL